METETRTALEWNTDLEAAPRYQRVWLMFGDRTGKGPWERIAQRIGDTWLFDCNQVNMFFNRAQFAHTETQPNWNHVAKLRTINAWAPLRYEEEQDPANIGPARKSIREDAWTA